MATGTCPLTWSHDKSPSDIWDLNGNVWEWAGGMRTVYGELQVLVNNNAADADNSQSASSSLWMAINGTTSAYITPNGSGTTSNSLKLDRVGSAWSWIKGTISDQADSSRNCTFENVTIDSSLGENAILMLQTLALYKYDATAGVYEGDYFYANNGASERSFSCGGSWSNGANAGLFGLSGGYATRSYSTPGIGFRCAYVKLPTV